MILFLNNIKPHPKIAQLHYAETFDSDFGLTLRERRSVGLDDMMSDVIEVEVKLMASGKLKQKLDLEKKKAKEESQPSSSHSLDVKFDTMINTMEKLMKILATSDKPIVGQQHETQIRNPNFRIPLFPQTRN
jgi:hypothetical protein